MNIEKLLNNHTIVVYIIPLFLGASSVFSFQPFNFTLVNFFIIPFLFLIITYVSKKYKSKYRKKPFLRSLFLIGYLFGIGFFLSGTFWISYSLTFDDNFKFLIPISLIMIPLFLGLFFGLATLTSGPFIKNDFISILFFCSVLSFFDFIRSKVLTGFPWNLWGYSWSWFTEAIQLLNPLGLFTFNLLSITIFCSPLLLIFKGRFNVTIFLILIALFFSNYIYGSSLINKSIKRDNTSNILSSDKNFINIKIISPNFDLKYNLSNTELINSFEKLIKYSEPTIDKKTIFIWPEGIFTGYNFSELNKFETIFKKNFNKNHLVVFGINTKEKNKIFNSLVVVNNDFEIIYKYNKKKLVPFGEFLPFEVFLNKFGLKKITHGHGSFSKGDKQKNLILEKANILPLICYEIIFPELIQSQGYRNNLIINISEDAWFGGSIGPYQHFAKAIFRSVENNTYLARSANQGISAFISNNGQVIKKLEPNETGNIEFEVPLIVNNNKHKNDLIFFTLLFTYVFIFFTLRNKFYD